jgi:four helix bundle protein
MEAWKHARNLSKEVYRITDPERFNYDYALIRQIRRSSGSIMDNIAEGYGRGGNKEFIRFLLISMGSTFELKSQLYRAMDQNCISRNEFQLLYTSADGVCKMINGLVGYLKKSNYKGSKYNQESNQKQRTNNQEQRTNN